MSCVHCQKGRAGDKWRRGIRACRYTLELKLQGAFVSFVTRTRGQVHAVPIVRYFLWVGSTLIALLLMAGWYWPSTPSISTQTQQAVVENQVERTIRIQSERKWPERMVFDTTVPTIVPPPSPTIAPPPVATADAAPPPAAATPAAAPLVEARAEMKQPPRPAPRRQAKVRHHNPRPDNYNNGRPDFWGSPPSTFASASPGWSFRW